MQHRPALRHLELDAGESLFFHSKAGSALISTSGTLLVTGAPRWLGEQMFRDAAALEPGQSHAVAEDGWITVTAQHGGAACLVSQPARVPLPQKLAAAAQEWLGRLSGITRSARGRYRSAKPV
jgi:hypothetical protein